MSCFRTTLEQSITSLLGHSCPGDIYHPDFFIAYTASRARVAAAASEAEAKGNHYLETVRGDSYISVVCEGHLHGFSGMMN